MCLAKVGVSRITGLARVEGINFLKSNKEQDRAANVTLHSDNVICHITKSCIMTHWPWK